MIDKTEFTKSMKYLTESARISSAYGMILNESRERAFDGRTVQKTATVMESEKKCCETDSGKKESVLFTIQRFKEDVDGNDIKKFKIKKYSSKNTREDIAEWFSEKYDENGSVMNTKVDDDTYVATIPTDDGYDKYVLKFLKDVEECGGSKKVKKVEESDDTERSKKVFYLDIRVPHGETEDDETFEDMKYARDYSLLKDAVDKAKEAYAEYVKDHPEVEVNIWGGEERRPTGDVYGEPWVYCTVKGDGCDFSDEEIAEEDAHDDYFLWRSEEAEKGNADVKESEEDEDETTIGNIDDMEDVEETETLTPEAEKMVERDSAGWSNFGSNMPDNHVAFKNRLVVSSNYNNGIVGQSNLIAALKRLEEAGFKNGDDFGVLSAGGFGGHAYYLWYDRDNVKLSNMLSGIEKELEDYVLLDEDLHSAMESYLCDWYWNDADEGTKAEYYEKHGEKAPDVHPIPKPEFYNDNGDVTSMTAEQTLSDPELRKMAKEYAIKLPKSYFE